METTTPQKGKHCRLIIIKELTRKQTKGGVKLLDEAKLFAGDGMLIIEHISSIPLYIRRE